MYQQVAIYDRAVPSLEELTARSLPLLTPWTAGGHATRHGPPVWEAFFEDLRAFIPGKWETAMLVALRELGGTLPFHHDEFDAKHLARYHLVLQTNDRCWTLHDNCWQRPEAGHLYHMDPRQEHAAVNFGPTPRVHLVVDVQR